MADLLKKLQYKNQKEVFVIHKPEDVLFQFPADVQVYDKEVKTSVDFFIAFVTDQQQVNRLVKFIKSNASEDPSIWFAYPKKSSKRYRCSISRDSGWQALGEIGYEGVRQVAIDEDWSALRFRQAKNIKKMTRSFAMSEEGKKRTKK